MQKHTPGPWKVYLTTDGREVIGIGDANGEGITDCGFGVWRFGSEEGRANANLIAAAPDLLEALKTLLAVWENENKEPGWVKRFGAGQENARAAISKAEGH